jgi:hypothetical protein
MLSVLFGKIMELEIVASGYHDMLEMTIRSIAMVFSDSIISLMTAALFLLYFLVMIFRSTIDDKQPSALKEGIIFLFLFIVLASPTAPKVEVKLLSKHNLSDFASIPDVPFIVAFPYYVASTFANGLIETSAVAFGPVAQESLNSANPIQMIMRLYNQEPSPPIITGGFAGSGFNLAKTMDNYIAECFAIDIELDGADPTSTIEQLRSARIDRNFIEKIKVDFNGINTTTFLQRGGPVYGSDQTCPEAYNRIVASLLEIDDDIIASNIKKGIDSGSVESSLKIITGSLTSGMTAYDLQTGLFAAKLIRDGIAKSSLATEIELTSFQAGRERLMSKVAEQSMFENITLPVITAMECLIFFLTPLYVILLGLGSKGMMHMAKYFMLMIFVCFWQYMNMYIQFYQYNTISAALNITDGTDPFSFDTLPYTIAEIEGSLATAASLSMVIPFLLMFLMYGGVHSLMGAMRGMTDVKASGKMSAPDITSAQNNGSRQIAEVELQHSMNGGQYQNIKGSNNAYAPSLNGSDTATRLSQSSVSEANSIVEKASTNYNQSLNNASMQVTGESFSDLVNLIKSDGASTSENSSVALGAQIANQHNLSAEESARAVIEGSIGVSTGKKSPVNLAIGGKGSVENGIGDGNTSSNGSSENDAYTNAVGTVKTTVASDSENYTVNESKTRTETKTELESASQALEKARNLSATVLDSSAKQDAISVTQQIDLNAVTPENLTMAEGQKIFDDLVGSSKSVRESVLDNFGTDNFQEIMRDNNLTFSGGGTPGNALLSVISSLQDDDRTFDDKARGLGENRMENSQEKLDEAKAFRGAFTGIANSIEGPQSIQFERMAAKLSESIDGAEQLRIQSEAINNEIDSMDTSKAKAISTEQFEELDEMLDSTLEDNAAKVVAAGNGVKGANSEEIAAQIEQQKRELEQSRKDDEESFKKAMNENTAYKAINLLNGGFFGDTAEHSYNQFVDGLKSNYIEDFKATGGDANNLIDSRMFDDVALIGTVDGIDKLSKLDDGELIRAYSALDYITNNKDIFGKETTNTDGTVNPNGNPNGIVAGDMDKLEEYRSGVLNAMEKNGFTPKAIDTVNAFQSEIANGSISSANAAEAIGDMRRDVSIQGSQYNSGLNKIDNLDGAFDIKKLSENKDFITKIGAIDGNNPDVISKPRYGYSDEKMENGNFATKVGSMFDYESSQRGETFLGQTDTDGRDAGDDVSSKAELANKAWDDKKDAVNTITATANSVVDSNSNSGVDGFGTSKMKALQDTYKSMNKIAQDIKPEGDVSGRLFESTRGLNMQQYTNQNAVETQNTGQQKLALTRVGENGVNESAGSAYNKVDTYKGEMPFQGIVDTNEGSFNVYGDTSKSDGMYLMATEGDQSLREYNPLDSNRIVGDNGNVVTTLDELQRQGAGAGFTSTSNVGTVVVENDAVGAETSSRLQPEGKVTSPTINDEVAEVKYSANGGSYFFEEPAGGVIDYNNEQLTKTGDYKLEDGSVMGEVYVNSMGEKFTQENGKITSWGTVDPNKP